MLSDPLLADPGFLAMVATVHNAPHHGALPCVANSRFSAALVSQAFFSGGVGFLLNLCALWCSRAPINQSVTLVHAV
jgi:hypothetical protein